jgi:hypothetical protein
MGKLAGVAGAVVGNMIAPGIGGQIGGALAGSLFGGSGGGGGGGNVSGAYDAASAAQLQAARNAQFRPVGITTSFGKSNFEIDPNTGMLKSAGYTLAPELQGLQTNLLGGYGTALQQAKGYDIGALQQGAQSLYGLGQGYLGESPDAVRQRYISQQQALLAPENEQTLAGIRNRLFATGRTGLATGGTSAGNMAATNPEMAAYYNALARQQAQLAAGAEQAAQQQITFGQGLLTGGAGLQGTGLQLQSAAYDPLKTQLGIGTQIESLGQQTLGLGSELGGRASTAAANAGQFANNAAMTGLAGQIAQQGIDATRKTASQQPLLGLLTGQGGGGGALGGLGSTASSWFNNLIGGGGAIGSEVAGLGGSVYNPFGGYYTGSDGWGNYGE